MLVCSNDESEESTSFWPIGALRPGPVKISAGLAREFPEAE
jgi:hypothetical protein